MSNLNIDERNINELIISLMDVIERVMIDVETLKDTQQDLFNRYMSYARLVPFFNGVRTIMQIQNHTFFLGFDMNNEVFKTEEFKKNNWDINTIKVNPFFAQDGCEIEDSIKQALQKRKEEKKQEENSVH